MRTFAGILQAIPAVALLALSACAPEAAEDRADPVGPGPGSTDPGEEWGTPVEGPSSGGGGGTTSGDPWDQVDMDGDGFRRMDGDCDDNDPLVNPDAPEQCDGIDNDCNGDVDDNLGWTSVSETDSYADGVPDTWSYTTYRSTGQLWYRETDSGADGTIDTSEEYFYHYDAIGRLSAIEYDDGIDGTIDERKSYYYDALGRLIWTENDEGPDGIPDRIDTYVYDPVTGIRTAWEMDTDGDGLANTIYNYDYDDAGILQGLILDRYDSYGTITSSMIYEYEYQASTGKLGWVHVDLTADGLLDNTTEYAYDALGRTDYTSYDIGRDGLFDSYTWYNYNTMTGDLETIEIDSDADGNLDTRITRWDECHD